MSFGKSIEELNSHELEEAIFRELNLNDGYKPVPMPKYSRSISGAWKVCDRMKEIGGEELKKFKSYMNDKWLDDQVEREICESALKAVTRN